MNEVLMFVYCMYDCMVDVVV